jgi:DNA-binding CsgD family transcriptional regulator
MFFDILGRISVARSYQEIHRLSLECCKRLGVDYFLYVVSVPDEHNRFASYMLSNLRLGEGGISGPQKVVLRANDIVQRTLGSITPVIWSGAEGVSLPVHTEQFISSIHNGSSMTDGVSMSVNGFNSGKGMMLFAVREGSIFDHDANLLVCLLHIIAPYVYERLASLQTHRSAPRERLSVREKECLGWLVQGKTSWEIGRILEIAERTADFHISNIVTKLNCRNRQQAIARAILRGDLVRSNDFMFEDVKWLVSNDDYAIVDLQSIALNEGVRNFV